MPLNTVQHAALILAQDGVILHPTETCYGFACDATRFSALKKIYALKRMQPSKPCSIMVPDLETAQRCGFFSLLAARVAREFWPGPLTLIVPRKNLPEFLNPGVETVGIRVPNHKWTLDLLRAYRSPLITTSANVSGQPEAYEVSEVLNQLEAAENQKPDFVFDVGKISAEKPSTILEVRENSLRMVRKGSLAPKILEKYFEYFHHGSDAQ